MYELRSGSAEVAIEYLDQAIRSEPEDEQLFIMRCKCLIKYVCITIQSLHILSLGLREQQKQCKVISSKPT